MIRSGKGAEREKDKSKAHTVMSQKKKKNAVGNTFVYFLKTHKSCF